MSRFHWNLLLWLDLYTNRKKWLALGGDPVPHMDSWSLFYFRHHWGIGDFRRLLSFLIQPPADFYKYLAKRLTPTREWIYYILEAIRQTCGSGSGLLGNPDSNPGSSLLDILALVEVCALPAQSNCTICVSILYTFDIGRKLRFFHTPLGFDAPLGGFPSQH